MWFNDSRIPAQSCEAVLPASAENCSKRMPSAISSQSVLCRFFAVAVLAIVGLASASTASATCGEYLRLDGNPTGHMHFPAGDYLAAVNGHSMPGGLPAPPCHGPNCSDNSVPTMPVPVAPPTSIQGFDDVAIIVALTQRPSPLTGREIPESERGASFAPSSVFRPPIA